MRLPESLDLETCDRLGLHLIEGDCPGSGFMGVHFTGDPGELNRELARRGLNLILETE